MYFAKTLSANLQSVADGCAQTEFGLIKKFFLQFQHTMVTLQHLPH